ncbi:hypothetical protein [Nocardia sp. NPDC057440]|uniref:hypothetical protein n=1 Tax=Nocardia sp. NPDC057440 TaxID=3346134 RepID=UPI00366A747D
MAQDFFQDPHGVRKQAGKDGMVGDATYAKSKRDLEWEESLNTRYGNASHAFNVFAVEYATVREDDLTTAGDRYHEISNESHHFANDLETEDVAHGESIRRTMT